MRFSISVEYAVHGLLYIVNKSGNGHVLIKDIAGSIAVPEAYLRKVFQQLTRGGLLQSQRGIKGGFLLARDPEHITLKDIVEAIEGNVPVYSCFYSKRECEISPDCVVQSVFSEAQTKMREILGSYSLKTIIGYLKKNNPSWLTQSVKSGLAGVRN